MKVYKVTFKDEFANFVTIVTADDEWHARRIASIFFYDTYALDFGLYGGDDIEVELEGEYL